MDLRERGLEASSSSQNVTDEKIKRTQAEVEEVTNIARKAVNDLIDRGNKLDEIVVRAEHLEQNSTQFRQQAHSLKRQNWWKNCKWLIILIVVVLIMLTVIIVSIVTATQQEQ